MVDFIGNELKVGDTCMYHMYFGTDGIHITKAISEFKYIVIKAIMDSKLAYCTLVRVRKDGSIPSESNNRKEYLACNVGREGDYFKANGMVDGIAKPEHVLKVYNKRDKLKELGI
jgi:hypothetical protein